MAFQLLHLRVEILHADDIRRWSFRFLAVTRPRLYVALSAILLILAALFLLVDGNMSQRLIASSDRRAAVYSHFTVYGYPGFVRISVKSAADANLYLELPDKSRYRLKDLPEDVARRYMQSESDERKNPVIPMDSTRFSSGKTHLVYRNGELSFATFEFPGKTFRFGPRLDGPFLELPADIEQLLATFGEPIEWREPGHRGPAY
jgi:hypothetical protein